MPDITVMTPDPIVKKLLSLLTAEMPEEAVLLDAAKDAIREDAAEKTLELTVYLNYQNGDWWVIADAALLDAISGGVLY